MSNSRQLSFGIMCESNHLSAWQIQSVRSLLQSKNIKLALIIKDGNPRPSFRKRLSSVKPGRILYLLYNKLFFKPICNRPVDASSYFKDTPVITCQTTLKGKFSQYFKEEDINTIKACKLDFILRFGFNIIRGEILNAATYGVWSFHHDDPMKYRGGPPGFWEIYNHDYANGAILQRLTNALDSGIILKKGFFKTCLYSYQKNIESLYSGSADWPALVCKDILSRTDDYLKREAVHSNAPIYFSPTNLQLVIFGFKIFGTRVHKIFHHLFFKEVWNVGVVDAPIQNSLRDDFKMPVHFIKKPSGHEFFADPFGYVKDGRNYVLVEQFDFKTNLGKIDEWNYENSDTPAVKENIFNERIHQSYPYIFSDNNQYYCLPEISRSGRLTLYKLVENQWRKSAVVLENIPCVDSSIVKYKDMYWLFYTRSDMNSDVNLYIRYAETLDSQWKEHAANPVKMDIRSSRPAGNFFWHNNELYRPAQNCAKTYGGSIGINKIVTLTENEFHEEMVKELIPWDNYYKHGIHTLSSMGDKTLIDGKRIVTKYL